MSDIPDNDNTQPAADDRGTNIANPSPDVAFSKAVKTSGNNLPERYTIKIKDDERILICLEAPNLKVHIDAGLTVSGSLAHKSPAGTIFLDGVAQCEPFMDHERQVYNFDHHEGCVRSFTKATCEQTLVMYMKGLDFQSRDWNIFANEPDLDAVLAIWIILNHGRIANQDATQRRILFALIHYEGLIDSLGLELKELSALPPELMQKIQRVVDHLRSNEVYLKKENEWEQTDFLAYTAMLLHKIDQIFYKADDFKDYLGIQELARMDLSGQRICAVVDADMGIYEIEPYLNKIYGSRLGIVFLKKGFNTYTVRQMDLFMPISLEEIYDKLNFADPAVKCRTQNNKWGGSADIGGSPRDSGTHMDPSEIVQACHEAVRKPGLLYQAYHFASTAVLLGAIVICALIVRFSWDSFQWVDAAHAFPLLASPDFGFIVTLLAASAVALIIAAYRRPWQYGWSTPMGKIWWLLLPLVLGAGTLGGAWTPSRLAQSMDWSEWIVLGALGMPLASELLFRGLGHGLMAQTTAIQRCDSRWFLSWPVVSTTLAYAAYMWILTVVNSPAAGWSDCLLRTSAAALFGLCLGMVRERSQSLLPAVLFHVMAACTALLFVRFNI